MDIFSDCIKFLSLEFKILAVGLFKLLNLGNHVVALLHSLVDEIDFIVYENCIVLNLFLQKGENFLLALELILNFFENAFLEHLWIVCSHFEDILNSFVKGLVVFL